MARNQFEYYDALGKAQSDADCTAFVAFMLRVIMQAIESIDIDQINEQIHDQITERQKAIVELLKKNPRATLEDVAAAAGASVATIRRDITKLRELRIVHREGSRKAGLWEVRK